MKNLLIISVSVAIGLIIGMFINCRSSSSSFIINHDEKYIIKAFAHVGNKQQDTIKALQDIQDSIIKAHQITKEKADEIISNYLNYDRKWYNASLRVDTVDSVGSNHLKSFYISKVLIDTIFKSDKNLTGIRLYMAKERDDNKKDFTFVITGTHNSKPLIDTHNKKQGGDGIYFNYVDTCPTNCN